MNWDAIGAIGEVIGALGVIITLGYLAFQLKQNTRALRASTYESYAETTRSNALFMSEHPAVFAKAFSKDGVEHLTAEEKIILQSYVYQSFVMVETSFLHSREDLVSKDVYEARIEAMRFAVQESVQRNLFVSMWPVLRNYGFVPEFVSLVDNVVATATGSRQ